MSGEKGLFFGGETLKKRQQTNIEQRNAEQAGREPNNKAHSNFTNRKPTQQSTQRSTQPSEYAQQRIKAAQQHKAAQQKAKKNK
ncbi:MAG: hypothetical protein AB4352_18850 [Hormoscilla sp.]